MARNKRRFGTIRKLPSGRYQALFTDTVGNRCAAPHTFASDLGAEQWLQDRRDEVEVGRVNPAAVVRPVKVTFREYAERWITERRVKGEPLRPRTREHYEALLADHIYPTFGTKPLVSITMDAVDRWHATTATGAPTLRAHAYSLLRTILETARTRHRIITANPCAIAGAGTTDRKITPKPATLPQLATIVGEMPEQYQLMTLLAAWCALRFGELVELRRDDIDLEDNVVKVRRGAVRVKGGWVVGDPKTYAGKRDVAIPPHLLPAVEHHLSSKYVGAEGDSLLFPAVNGGHLQPSTLARPFSRARAKAKRTDLRFHDLRHTGAVLAASTGATLAELMARLGHSTPQAAMRYQHASQDRDREIATLLSKLA
jgi:integrase